MIMINNEWYNPLDLDDVSKIVRDMFSYDLADKMDELVQSTKSELECEIDDLEILVSTLEVELENKDYEISELDEEIDELKEKIKELEENE